MNLTAPGSLADLGPWNIINRIQYALNIGSGLLIDTSGYGGYLVSHGIDKAFKGDSSALANVYSAPVANGNNTWNLTWFIPIAANYLINMELGPINLQAEQVRSTINVTCGTASDGLAAALFNTFTRTLKYYYAYWEVPDPDQVDYPPLWVHRILEEDPPILATGDTTYLVPRQGTLLRLWHVNRLNGARDSADITQVRLRYNKTTQPLVEDYFINQYLFRKQLGVDPPTGVVLHDRWYSQGFVGSGDLRDTIDTLPVATLESIVTNASGATLGSGNNFLKTLREFVEPLVV